MKKLFLSIFILIFTTSCSNINSSSSFSDSNVSLNKNVEIRFLEKDYNDKTYNLVLDYNLPTDNNQSITLKFDTNGGSVNPPDQTLTIGQRMVIPAAPTKPGFIFAGWKEKGPFSQYFDFTKNVSRNVNLEAQWLKFDAPSESDIRILSNLTGYRIISSMTLNQRKSINFDEKIDSAVAIISPVDARIRIYSSNTSNTASEKADPEFTLQELSNVNGRMSNPQLISKKDDLNKAEGRFDFEVVLNLKKNTTYLLNVHSFRLDKNKTGKTDIFIEYGQQVPVSTGIVTSAEDRKVTSTQKITFDNPMKNWGFSDEEINEYAPNYFFAGWYLNKEGLGDQFDLSSTLTKPSTTVYAKWSKSKVDYISLKGGIPDVFISQKMVLEQLKALQETNQDPYDYRKIESFLGWFDGPGVNSNLVISKEGQTFFDKIKITDIVYLYPMFKDVTPPTLELIGDSIIYLKKNEKYIEPGYVSKDNTPGEVEVIKNGEVDVSKDGEYILRYYAIDKSGNKSAEFERKVIVSSITPNVAFKFDRYKGEILDYDASFGENVNIPSTFQGVEVISIGFRAFSEKNLKNVVIPNSVKIIGDSAFKSNLISELIIPDSVEIIGQNAFADNPIEKLELGSGLIRIIDSAFKSNLISELIIPDSVEIIGLYAFASNPIEKLKLGSGLIRIEDSAFQAEYSSEGYKSKLKSVTIPSNVQVIRTYAFLGVALESIIIEGEISRFNKFWRYTGFPKNLMPGFTTNNGYDFDKIFGEIIAYDVNFGVNLIIPETIDGVAVKSIGTSAFFGKGIETLVLPETLELIGKNSFTRNFIKELIIPNNVITIDENAFAFNPIEKLSLGSGIKTIEKFAFQGPPTSLLEEKLYFSKLYDLVIPSQLLKLGYLSFSNNPLKSVTIEGNEKRFNNQWTNYGFPARLMP